MKYYNKETFTKQNGYWEGSFYFKVGASEYSPGTFTFKGTLLELLASLQKADELGMIDSEDNVSLEEMNESPEEIEQEGHNSWDIKFLEDEKPEFFDHFNLKKFIDENS